ncbi:MAG: glycoside hydrolase family 2 protein [Bacteroidota bacterium]|nr:glycoside hydrolase family 2 protein [Bacteroidota bacterium]
MKFKLFILLYACTFSLLAQNQKNVLSQSKWQFKSDKTFLNWMDAHVPGNVHTDLLKLNKIPNPHIGTNENELLWIAEEDWTYQTSFQITEEDLVQNNFCLSIGSLDTHAKLYLNNQLFGSNQNQFTPILKEIKPYLKVGNNILRIEFESSTKIARNLAQKLKYTLPGEDRVFVRKAQYQFVWDWSPKMVSYGIGDIQIFTWKSAKINHTYYEQKIGKDSAAELSWTICVEADQAQTVSLEVNSNEASIKPITKKFKLQAGLNFCKINQTIKKPIWWWSNGLGSAHLYTIQFKLVTQDKMVLKHQEKIGIRTIEWVQDKDAAGTSFYMKLNGNPVFMKGANYVPPHHFLHGLSPQTYTDLVAQAAQANMNMLRVWGGGVYAHKSFYEACDSLGILVWQDFMFACAMYPGDSSFLNNVSEEITAQVKRLRNHASLAIWCGNNENAEGWKHWGWQKQYQYSTEDSTQIANDYFKLFDSLIPKTLQTTDPNRFYWPSSPSFGWGSEKSLSSGDLHYWGIWWGLEPFENYKNKVGRFVSEYGFQALPNEISMQEMNILNNHLIDSNLLKSHQKHPKGFETIDTYLKRDYPRAKSPEDYIYLSQLLQAKGIKIAIESHRAAKPYCMGSLFWQLNDCWPSISWSSLDFYNRKKALHYQVKSSFNNHLLLIKNMQDSMQVQVISDQLTAQSGTLQLILWNAKGEALDQHILGIEIPANSNKEYKFSLNQNLPWNQKNEWVLQANLILPDGKMIKQAHYFVEPKNLQLPKPSLEIELNENNEISFFSTVLIKDLAIQFKDKNIEIEDNFFDLMPYQKVTLKLTGKNNEPIKLKENDYRIQSLNEILNK